MFKFIEVMAKEVDEGLRRKGFEVWKEWLIKITNEKDNEKR